MTDDDLCWRLSECPWEDCDCMVAANRPLTWDDETRLAMWFATWLVTDLQRGEA